MGWLFVKSRDHDAVRHFERYARDLLRNPFYLRLERRLSWLWVYAAHTAVFFAAGLAWGLAATGDPRRGLQCGVSLLVWGVVFRTVLVWHITWSVNSLSHLWGYQSYGTDDQSRNNWFVGLVSNGEGWHNNHHYDALGRPRPSLVGAGRDLDDDLVIGATGSGQRCSSAAAARSH